MRTIETMVTYFGFSIRMTHLSHRKSGFTESHKLMTSNPDLLSIYRSHFYECLGIDDICILRYIEGTHAHIHKDTNTRDRIIVVDNFHRL